MAAFVRFRGHPATKLQLNWASPRQLAPPRSLCPRNFWHLGHNRDAEGGQAEVGVVGWVYGADGKIQPVFSALQGTYFAKQLSRSVGWFSLKIGPKKRDHWRNNRWKGAHVGAFEAKYAHVWGGRAGLAVGWGDAPPNLNSRHRWSLHFPGPPITLRPKLQVI